MTDILIDVQTRIKDIKAAQDEINTICEKNIAIINEKTKEILDLFQQQTFQIQTQDIQTTVLLEIPDHMRKSLLTLMEKREATAEEISDKTERSRSLESAYLNSLTNWGYVKKNRKGQLVYYYPNYEKLTQK
jgi:DNA-binding transcriptional ArsR family regulator